MPLYEYHCKTCGRVFEKLARFSEADQSTACPYCDSTDTEKHVTKAAAVGMSASSGSSSSSCGSNGGFR